MAEKMNIPILGLVENMSFVTCPHCDEQINVFGESRIDAIAAEHGIDTVAKIPMDPKIAAACDRGAIELFEGDWLNDMAQMLAELPETD
ncbi:MAG: P-loop NTPase, partial [Eubacteriales bacterium]|nr:P-loop NTPase [Eubacteriales bacterium]